MARLMVDGEDRGPRFFVVPACNEHEKYEGVESIRFGPHPGTSPLDFSIMRFNHVHVPFTALIASNLHDHSQPASPLEVWWGEVWGIPLGTLAITGIHRVPMISSRTQQWPIPSTAFHNTFPRSFSYPVPETPQGSTTPGVTQHQATLLTTNDHPVPANNQVSPTGGRGPISTCDWDDGGGPCGIIVYKDRIAEHMKSFHVRSRVSSKSAVKCQWKGCQKTLRRDTIFRHISEKHYRIRRSKSRRRRAVPISCGRLP